uniref:Uncharacterized protein n=1 Tax=Leersia perrieri TaxID=77586 RepID=A0A0D9WUY0_9ORYZ
MVFGAQHSKTLAAPQLWLPLLSLPLSLTFLGDGIFPHKPVRRIWLQGAAAAWTPWAAHRHHRHERASLAVDLEMSTRRPRTVGREGRHGDGGGRTEKFGSPRAHSHLRALRWCLPAVPAVPFPLRILDLPIGRREARLTEPWPTIQSHIAYLQAVSNTSTSNATTVSITVRGKSATNYLSKMKPTQVHHISYMKNEVPHTHVIINK